MVRVEYKVKPDLLGHVVGRGLPGSAVHNLAVTQSDLDRGAWLGCRDKQMLVKAK